MLFRVEAAVLIGVTHPTCTMELAKWNVPSNKKAIKPGKLSNFLIKQDSYKKKLAGDSMEAVATKAKRKQNYTPLSEEGKIYFSNKKRVRSDIYNVLKTTSPNCCFVKVMEDKSMLIFFTFCMMKSMTYMRLYCIMKKFKCFSVVYVCIKVTFFIR